MQRIPSIAIVLGLTWSVVTAAACSSKTSSSFSEEDASASSGSSESGNPSSGSSGSSAGSGSGAHSGSGSASGSGSGSGSGSHSGSSGSSDGGAGCTPASCDLHQCTACVPQDGGIDAAVCLTGTNATCTGTNVATFHCSSSADCASGESCCGSFNVLAFTLDTSCVSGACPAAPPLCATGSQCQLCKQNTECSTGTCVDQTCQGNDTHFCALNTYCTAK